MWKLIGILMFFKLSQVEMSPTPNSNDFTSTTQNYDASEQDRQVQFWVVISIFSVVMTILFCDQVHLAIESFHCEACELENQEVDPVVQTGDQAENRFQLPFTRDDV